MLDIKLIVEKEVVVVYHGRYNKKNKCIIVSLIMYSPSVHTSPCFRDVDFTALTGNPVSPAILFTRIDRTVSLGRTKCYLSVVSELKMVQMPCFSRHRLLLGLTPAQIADHLDFVLRSTYFQYDGSIYEQREGAAMGSPVSAVIANRYMEIFEGQLIESAPFKLKIWKRYVDNTIPSPSSTETELTALYNTLTVNNNKKKKNSQQSKKKKNSQQPTIRFTMKTENVSKIAYIDASVSKEPDGCLITSVYSKRMNSH